MISERDLQEAIADCHGVKNPNANTCLKLAAYYTIMDHINDEPSYSYSTEPPRRSSTTYSSGSEFGETIRGKDINDVLSIMDELMDTLSIVNPRLYNGVLAKLN